jgi:hypothetical protein
MAATQASADRRLQRTGGQRRLRGKAAHRGPAGAAGLVVEGLSGGVALAGQRTADQLAGIDHVIRLGLAGGVASIVTEAGAFEELSELPCLGLGQDDGDLDDMLLSHDARPSLGLDVAAAGIDLSLDAPGKAAVLEQTSQLQGAVELI